MKGIESIKSVIMDEASAQAERLIKEGADRAAKTIEQGEAQAAAILAEKTKEAELRYNDIKEKAALEGKLLVSRGVLRQKQGMVDTTFQKATERLEGLAPRDMSQLIASLIKSATADGKGGTIVMNKHCLNLYSSAVMALLGSGYTLCDQAEDLGTGAIVRRGRIEYNCQIKAIVGHLKDTQAQEVWEILFRG